ncbi:MAG: ABC transporter substrate-binding protein, partial [Acidimicrobiia bacterium]
MPNRVRRAPAALKFLTLLFALVLVAAACGGGDDDSSDGGGGSSGSSEGTPVEGGKITYALEGKTTQFCLPRANLAIAGILVVEAIYDTLTVPTRNPQVYAPYLAKSVTPNADYTQWTIVLRPNITFHDGTPLDANAVKQNIDAWTRGILLGFVFQNIAG